MLPLSLGSSASRSPSPKRFKPKTHFFKYSVFSLLIDLSELDQLDKNFYFFLFNIFYLISFFVIVHVDRDGS